MTMHTRTVQFLPTDVHANERYAKAAIWIIIGLFATNQLLLNALMPQQMAIGRSTLSSLFGAKAAAAATIIMPKINPDGKTTSLGEQPTITDVPANPKSGNDVADAKVVMIATGKPFYAPDTITFDDPIKAEELWGKYEGMTLSAELQKRYDDMTTTFPCNYCCGEPMQVTRNRQCGCAHAKAARGFFKYMLQQYGSKYSNDQLMGEQFRWQALWYPRGAVADYLLAIGKSEALQHQTHGGAGSDGMHGLTK